MYPTSRTILASPVAYRPATLRAVRAWKRAHRGVRRSPVAIRALLDDLGCVYGSPVRVRFAARVPDHYTPSTRTITLDAANLSIVTVLHEFAHHLFGASETRACRWSIWIFIATFPRSYARCRFVGHVLRRRWTNSLDLDLEIDDNRTERKIIMCVILTADRFTRLSADEIRAAVEANPDGNGIAYLNKGVVVWKKNITTDAAIQIARTVNGPVVFHARIATAGGIVPNLCHPFAISRNATGLETSGRSRAVLFHNGHWHDWTRAYDAWEPLDGPVSDSRFMAHMAAHGVDLAACIPTSQRLAVFDRHGVERIGDGWTRVRPGVWASNLVWTRRLDDVSDRSTVRTVRTAARTSPAPASAVRTKRAAAAPAVRRTVAVPAPRASSPWAEAIARDVARRSQRAINWGA